jgi:hypothetical protein
MARILAPDNTRKLERWEDERFYYRRKFFTAATEEAESLCPANGSAMEGETLPLGYSVLSARVYPQRENSSVTVEVTYRKPKVGAW